MMAILLSDIVEIKVKVKKDQIVFLCQENIFLNFLGVAYCYDLGKCLPKAHTSKAWSLALGCYWEVVDTLKAGA